MSHLKAFLALGKQHAMSTSTRPWRRSHVEGELVGGLVFVRYGKVELQSMQEHPGSRLGDYLSTY